VSEAREYLRLNYPRIYFVLAQRDQGKTLREISEMDQALLQGRRVTVSRIQQLALQGRRMEKRFAHDSPFRAWEEKLTSLPTGVRRRVANILERADLTPLQAAYMLDKDLMRIRNFGKSALLALRSSVPFRPVR